MNETTNNTEIFNNVDETKNTQNIISYTKDEVNYMFNLLNSLTISGISNMQIISKVAEILNNAIYRDK